MDYVVRRNNLKELPHSLDYVSCLLHLSVCGIFGLLWMLLLHKFNGFCFLFSVRSSVVLKADISTISEHLDIGLTTGYLGSLTTFSGWNQKMLDLSVNGQWVYASLGFLCGKHIVSWPNWFCPITFSPLLWNLMEKVTTAKGFKGLLGDLKSRSTNQWSLKSYKSHLAVMIALLLVLGVLLVASGLLDAKEFRNGGSEAHLWLACFLAPLGVWIRWTLTRLNGRGIGKSGQFNWVPLGTLAANIGAASMMAALATVNTKNCDTVASGMQFGLLGCMSTVSTFMAEFHTMSPSNQLLRAFAYAAVTVVPSFGIGILIYCIPVWTKRCN
uniref:CrcB-like protein n=1 Tax=Kalanchoe fedtschenkoi TaxID=63787 RepID=A0A7N1A5W4_KALFE